MNNYQFIPESMPKDSDITELTTPILGSFTGIFGKVDSMSVNKRFYSKDFWTKVLNSPKVKSDLRMGHLFGTINHPNRRIDYTKEGEATARHIINASHVTKELSIDSEGNIIGRAFIFNNPLGRLLASYLLATDPSTGRPLVELSISARGYSQKDYFDSNGIDQMNPFDYELEGFDVVLKPGIPGARIKFESDDSANNEMLSKLESQSKRVLDKLEADTRFIDSLRTELKLKHI